MSRFTITIPCKPYVKKYLKNNFGEPADLKRNIELNTSLRNKLSKPSTRFDKKYPPLSKSKTLTTKIEIYISHDDFYRYGWELTKTDTIIFNRQIELMAKIQMRHAILQYCLFMSVKDAILKFQTDFNYSEDDWPYESIRKDIQRKLEHKPNILKKIAKELQKNYGEVVPQKRQLSKQEENKK